MFSEIINMFSVSCSNIDSLLPEIVNFDSMFLEIIIIVSVFCPNVDIMFSEKNV